MAARLPTQILPIDVRGVGGHPFMTSTRRREGFRLRWSHVDGGGGPAPCGRPHRKLKLESTDVILSSSHAKKLAPFFTRISSLDRKKISVFKYFPGFSGVGEVSDKYIYRERYFSGAGEVFKYTFGVGEAWEVFKTPFLRRRTLYTLFRRRRSAYIHLSGTGEAGEVFIYTAFLYEMIHYGSFI